MMEFWRLDRHHIRVSHRILGDKNTPPELKSVKNPCNKMSRVLQQVEQTRWTYPYWTTQAATRTPLLILRMDDFEVLQLHPTFKFLMNSTTLPSGSLSIIVWNCRGAGSRIFSHMRELVRRYNPVIFALMENKVSGSTADEVCRRSGFDGS